MTTATPVMAHGAPKWKAPRGQSEWQTSKHVFLSQSQQLQFRFYEIICQINGMAQNVTGFLVYGSLLCKLFFVLWLFMSCKE